MGKGHLALSGLCGDWSGLWPGRSLLTVFLSIGFPLGVLPWWAHSSHCHGHQQHRENSEEDQSSGYVFFYHCLDSLRTRRPWWEGWKRQNLVPVDCLSRQYGVHQEFVPPPHLLLFVCCYSLGKTLRLFSWLVVICLAQFQAPVCRVYTGKAWHCGRQSRSSPSLPLGSPVGRASVSAMLS